MIDQLPTYHLNINSQNDIECPAASELRDTDPNPPTFAAGSAARATGGQTLQRHDRGLTLTHPDSDCQSMQAPDQASDAPPLSTSDQALATDAGPSSETLPEADDRLIAEQEGIMEIYIQANARAEAAKDAAPAAKRDADGKGVDAAVAILKIQNNLGKGALQEYGTIHGCCKVKWGFSKSHTYRLVNVGSFLARYESQSPKEPFGDWRPTSEGQIRKFLKIVPDDKQVACWKEIVAKTRPDKLTGNMVTRAAMEFMRRQPGAVVEHAPRHDVGKKIDSLLTKMCAVLKDHVDPEEYEPFVAGIREVAIRLDRGVAAGSKTGSVGEVHPEDESDGEDESEADAGASTGLVSDESAAPKPAKSRRKAAHSRPRGTKHAADPLVPRVVGDCTRTPEVRAVAQSESSHPACPPLNYFMNCRLLHSFLRPAEGYGGWLAAAQRDHPNDFTITDDGGDALIDLNRARSISYLDKGPSSRFAFRFIVHALNQCPGRKGAAADALFTEALAISGPEQTAGEDLQILYGGLVGGSGFKPSARDAEQNI